MNTKPDKRPKRTAQHETGSRAIREFESNSPDNWSINRIDEDYGRDLIVTIAVKEDVKDEFNVQVKGSEKPDYSSDEDFISFSLEVSTATYLLNMEEPSMLAICDVSKADKPVYWGWLNEDIKRIKATNPNWQSQNTIAFRVPTSNKLDENGHKEIESYVLMHLAIQKIDKAGGSFIRNILDRDPLTLIEKYGESPNDYVMDELVETFKTVQLISVEVSESGTEIKTYSDYERELLKKLDQVSIYLNSTQDTNAKVILEEIENDVEQSALKEIKARFLNSKGVLATHNGDRSRALEYYEQANSIIQTEPKYITNLLYTQFEIAKANKENGELNLPSDWEDRLKKVLEEKPDFVNPVRINAQVISETHGTESAEDYLRKSEHWKNEQVGFLSLLSELYYESGNLDRALALLEEAEPLISDHPWYFWAQYGSKCLIKAIGSDEFVFRGYGPANVDIRLLNKAYNCYNKAIKSITAVGYPSQSATAIVNYSVACMLVGKPEESNAFCTNFLEVNPDNLFVSSAFAASLFRQGEGHQALPYVRSVYEANPEGKSEYRNYALILLYSEDYENLLKLIHERERNEFVDKEEEGLSRELASVSLFELGDYDQSENQIEMMRNDTELRKRAVIAEAFIARKKRSPKDEILNIYRGALKDFPDDEELLTKYVLELGTDVRKYAKEIRESLEIVIVKRELIPEEYYLLENAYIELGQLDEAIDILTKAGNRFPFDNRFISEKANAYMKKGDDETAYKLLQDYTKKVGKKFEVLRSTAALAMSTGRLDEDIKFFQLALSKSDDVTEQGVLHCQLWHLKIKRGDSPKDILRHVVEFGSTIEEDPEAEASYLTMVLFSPKIDSDDSDQDVKSWINEFQNRLEAFKKKFPKSKMFRAISIPERLEGEELLNELLAEMFKLTVEDILGAIPFEYSSRTMPWFTTMRAKLLRESDSVFMFWNICMNSDDYSHAIHIWNGATNIDKEHTYGLEANEVCIDLTALLTLSELDLLDIFADEFTRIYTPIESKMIIDRSIFTPFDSHPIAEKLENWRIRNRHKIRALHTRAEIYSNSRFELSSGGLLVQTDRGIPVIFEDDPNYQAMRLSNELGVTLYSDEYLSRYWSIEENKIKAFSTLSFINRLKEKGAISREKETALLSQMINKNFRFVRFNSYHLFERLSNILSEKGESLKYEDLKDDDIFNTFFRQFSDASLESRSLVNMATDLWLMILKDKRIKRDFKEDFVNQIVINCMYLPSFSFSINKKNREERVALLWAVFLWRTYKESEYYFQRAWSCIKSCCEGMFPKDEDKYERILFNHLPKILGELINLDIRSANDKVRILVTLPNHLSDHDKEKFDDFYVQNPPSFMNERH